MRELAFRTAVLAARVTDEQLLFYNTSLIEPGKPLIKNWTQSVQVSEQQMFAVYTISLPYMIAAAILSLLAIPAIIRLYYGWWELGRSISLDPLELAKAFNAPQLEMIDGNAKGVDIAQQVRRRRVRYGVVDGVDSTKKGVLKLDDEEVVRKPKLGEIFG
jgi:hypothetical protein